MLEAVATAVEQPFAAPSQVVAGELQTCHPQPLLAAGPALTLYPSPEGIEPAPPLGYPSSVPPQIE